MLDIEELRKHFSYIPETGDIIRLIGDSRRKDKPAGTVKLKHKDSPAEKYLMVGFKGKRYQAHKIAWLLYYGKPYTGLIDHANGNSLDNRLCNLREATYAQNSQNSVHLIGATGLKGIRWHKRTQRWRARCGVNNKRYEIGSYKTPEEASAAYEAFAADHHGEFYYKNREQKYEALI